MSPRWNTECYASTRTNIFYKKKPFFQSFRSDCMMPAVPCCRCVLILLALPALQTATAAADYSTDDAALRALYDATNGDGWVHGHRGAVCVSPPYQHTGGCGWKNATAGHCAWYGVRCDPAGAVTGCALSASLCLCLHSSLCAFGRLVFRSDNNLDGTLPPALFNLTELTHFLTFQHNPLLRGSIPHQIGQLTKLQRLYMFSNGLTGTLSNSVKELTALTVM